MALSKRKTTIAVLRAILGSYHGREDQFAKLANRSRSWVKKVSANIEPLTEEVARALELSTGIGLVWLLAGDPGAPPFSARNEPYDHDSFEKHRAELRNGVFHDRRVFDLVTALTELAGVGSAAGQRGKVSLFAWRIAEFLEKCRAEFGTDENAVDRVERELSKAEFSRLLVLNQFIDLETRKGITLKILRRRSSRVREEPPTRRTGKAN